MGRSPFRAEVSLGSPGPTRPSRWGPPPSQVVGARKSTMAATGGGTWERRTPPAACPKAGRLLPGRQPSAQPGTC